MSLLQIFCLTLPLQSIFCPVYVYSHPGPIVSLFNSAQFPLIPSYPIPSRPISSPSPPTPSPVAVPTRRRYSWVTSESSHSLIIAAPVYLIHRQGVSGLSCEAVGRTTECTQAPRSHLHPTSTLQHPPASHSTPQHPHSTHTSRPRTPPQRRASTPRQHARRQNIHNASFCNGMAPHQGVILINSSNCSISGAANCSGEMFLW